MERLSRPGVGRRNAVRRSVRARGGSRRLAVSAPAPAAVGLTTRAALLGLVLCALVVSAALPLREYLAQRGTVAELRQAQALQRDRVQALEEQRRLLDDPAHVASLARERLHYVLPGETTYVVLGPDPEASTPPAGPVSPARGEQSPWWSQLWGSARAADVAPP